MDFDDPKRTRYAKASARVYARITQTNRIDWNYKPGPEIHIPAPDDESHPNSARTSISSVFLMNAILFIHLLRKLF